MTPTQIAVLMIVVHWVDLRLTLRFLESARKVKRSTQLHLVVVSNDPNQEHVKELSSFASKTTNLGVVQPEANLGYFGGAKFAVDRYCAGRGQLPDWVIVSNNDVVIEDETFLEKLLKRDPKEVGVIAPRIYSTLTLSDQNPFMRRRPGHRQVAKLRFWLMHYRLAWALEQLSIYKRRLQARLNPNHEHQPIRELVYAPQGSFIIFSRTFFERGGDLAPPCFLYGEEIFVAEQCRQFGLPVSYEPDLVVLHDDEHRSKGRKVSRAQFQHLKEALAYYERQFSGNFT